MRDQLLCALCALLQSAHVTLLGFGMQEDIDRVAMAIGPCDALGATVDLQKICHDNLPSCRMSAASGANPISLQAACWALLGCTMQKSKLLQMSDWSAWPLSQAQLAYAATDAAVLVRMYMAVRQQQASTMAQSKVQTLGGVDGAMIGGSTVGGAGVVGVASGVVGASNGAVSSEHARDSPGIANLGSGADELKPATCEVRPGAAGVALFCGLFLDRESVALLGRHCLSKHERRTADHVTIVSKPSQQQLLRLLPLVGERFSLRVVGEAADSLGHALHVELLSPTLHELCANATPHITISHSAAAQPSYSNQLLSNAPLQRDSASAGLELSGVLGVAVARAGSNGLELLPTKVREQVEEFARDALPGAKVSPSTTLIPARSRRISCAATRMAMQRVHATLVAQLRFQPEQLDARERHILHNFAEARGMKSESEGKKAERGRPDGRRLTLTKPTR